MIKNKLGRNAVKVVLTVLFCACCIYTSKADLLAPKPGCSQGAYTTYVRITFNSVGGAVGYAVFRCGNTDINNAEIIGTTTTTEYRDYAVKPGAKYYYWVCPVDANGDVWYNSSRYARGYAKKPSVSAPKATDGTIAAYTKITWESVSGATQYYVYYSPTKSINDGYEVEWDSSRVATHTGTPGKKYYYWVGAVVNGYIFRSKKSDVGWRKKVLTIYTPKVVLIQDGDESGTGWWFAALSGDLIAPSKASLKCSKKGCATMVNYGMFDDDGYCGDITGYKSGTAYITIKHSKLSVKSKGIKIIKWGYNSASAS